MHQIRSETFEILQTRGGGTESELFLFSEEHGEAYDRAVDEQTADNTHDHGLDPNLFGVRQYDWECCDSGVSEPIAMYNPSEIAHP